MRRSPFSRSAASPQLRLVAALWTIVGHPGPGRREWSLARKLRAIREAGFESVCGVFDDGTAAAVRDAGLEPVALFFGCERSDYPSLIASAGRTGATLANVQLMGHDLPAAEALRRWLELERRAADQGIELSLETHRDTVTETPEKLFALAARYEQKTGRLLRLTWDFSHLAVVKHIDPATVAARYLGRPELIQHASQFHFRPFNAHHAQIPVTHKGRLTPEMSPYLDFVTQVMTMWKAGAANGARTLHACPELGPVSGGYNLSSLSPAWPDALRLRAALKRCWRHA